jgi:hypothetical protein
MASTVAKSRPVLERLLRAAAPGDLAVCVHDPITGDERAVTDMVRALGVRLWVAWGANSHVCTACAKGPAAVPMLPPVPPVPPFAVPDPPAVPATPAVPSDRIDVPLCMVIAPEANR